MIEIHAYHGWGFDGSFWDELKSQMPDDVLFKSADRGYFGGEFIPEFDESSTTKIILSHSYGLHWCESDKIDQADFLIAFNAFDEFLPLDFFERRRESKVIKLMAANFKKAPKEVLKAFYHNCFYPDRKEIEIPSWRNDTKLYEDLLRLRKTKLKLSMEDTELIVFGSVNDKIIPLDRTRQIIKDRQVKKSKIFEKSGHALPVVNSSECWSFICEVVPIFEVYANTDKSK